jgi:hypothetical protein
MPRARKSTQSKAFIKAASKLGCDEDKDDNAVIGSFRDRSPVPDKIREVMRANSQAVAGLTMKALC